MSKNHFLPLFLIACATMLASCSTLINGSTQQVSFKTVGAEDAYCTVLAGANDYRYAVRPPQTIWVQRGNGKMTINCTAPGNRTKELKIDSSLAEATYVNGLAAGTTAIWDAGSGAMYEYPDKIVIDFTGVTAKDQPLPSYDNVGALNPKDQGIEYLGPDTPALETDKADAERYKAAYAEAARQDAEDAANAAEKERRLDSVEGGFYGDKGADKSEPHAVVPKSNAAKAGKLKKSDEEVQIAPLSDAAPAPKTSPSENGVNVPVTNPQLGKPIFPSSTTF